MEYGLYSKKTQFNKRYNMLKQEAANYTASWSALRTYITPTRGQFDETKPIRGTMIDHKTLLDGHATQSNRILGSGLNSGMTSKSRPWFRLTLSDLDMLEYPGVRQWLDEVQRRMYTVLEKSNLYGVFQNTYEELGSFGTGCYCIVEDFDDVIRARGYTIGEYYLGTDSKGRVNSFARWFYMTAGQMVSEFGLESVSPMVRAAFNNNEVDKQYLIRHLIEPNETRIVGMEDFQNMPFRSAYWEASDGTENFLAMRGFKRFPIIAPRWETITTDRVYGEGPGWFALGNIRQLQKTVLDKLIAQEKSHNPPMQADAAVEGHTNFLPGGLTKTSTNIPNVGVRPAYQIDPQMASFQEAIANLYDQIDRDFFVNLFLMLINVDQNKMTATEVAERQQEKLMMMGPILHKLDEEMLSPTLELIFDIMFDNGLIPEPPQSIQGVGLKVQYISILAQAQRAMGVTQIERLMGFVGNFGMMFPDMLDLIDVDETIRQLADMEGVPSKIIKDKVLVEAERDQKARMQQAQTMAALANSAADSAQKLGKAQMGQDTALDRIMSGTPAQ